MQFQLGRKEEEEVVVVVVASFHLAAAVTMKFPSFFPYFFLSFAPSPPFSKGTLCKDRLTSSSPSFFFLSLFFLFPFSFPRFPFVLIIERCKEVKDRDRAGSTVQLFLPKQYKGKRGAFYSVKKQEIKTKCSYWKQLFSCYVHS